jgi:signal transduction histidine kinase/ActR/RegA family two-component response regulator
VRLRSHLVLLVLAVLVPMVVFSTIVIVAFGRQQRAAVRDGAVETARALMNAIDESLSGSVSKLQALATARSLDRGDLGEFDVEVKRVLASQPDWLTIVLLSPDGRQVVNALRPLGQAPVGLPDRGSFETVLVTLKPVIGDLTFGPVTRQYDLPVRVPVLRRGMLVYVLTAVIKPASLVPVLARQRIPGDWVGSVFDRKRNIVARTKNIELFLGRPVSPEFEALLGEGRSEGWAVTHTLEGVEVGTAYARSPVSGWGIGLGIPVSALSAPLRRSLLTVAIGGIVVVVLAVLAAIGVGRRITSPIVALAGAARGFGEQGRLDAGRPAGVTEVEEVRRAFIEAAALVQRRAAEAEAANRTKDEFLTVLSHELRTPLNAVYGWARMLQAGQVDEATTARALEVIVRQSNAQVQLIDDLLDVSRIQVGKMRLDLRQVALPAVIEGALDAVRPAATAKGIRLQPVIDPMVGRITGDPQRLQQVVWNLLMNSVKFTPKGGRVQVYLQRVNSQVEIVVSDDGQGIPGDVLPFVFEPFRQGDSSSTRAHSGLGLGLALVKDLVELHGGTVTARSDGPGQGATFVVALPLPIAQIPEGRTPRVHPTAASEQPAGVGAVRLDGVRVLAVDDDPDALELATFILGGAGAQVRTCLSAREARGVLREWRPDVLVSDIEMPGEDGYALIRWVRGLSAHEGGRTPAVALTAYGRTEDRVLSLTAGYSMHVPKPVDPGEFTTIIASLAGRAHSVAE